MRRRYQKGKFEDKNKYFRCPVCGFMLDKDRNHPSDRTSKSFTEIVIKEYPYDTKKPFLVLDTLTWLGSVKRYPEEKSVSIRQVTINQGCPFCGNVNF